MKILALEFSSPQRSVAILQAKAGTENLVITEVVEANSKVSNTFSLIEEVLNTAHMEREQVECLVVGLGPGSYTGIRAAIAVAQGWQLARSVSLLGISSAECVAAQAQSEGFSGQVNVVINAQRNEFYLAGYELSNQTRRLLAPLHLATTADVQKLADAGQILIGPEVTTWFPRGQQVFPRAGTLAKLALGRTDFTQGEKLEPLYLRETKFLKAPPPRSVPMV